MPKASGPGGSSQVGERVLAWLSDTQAAAALEEILYHGIEGLSLQRPERSYRSLVAAGGVAREIAAEYSTAKAKVRELAVSSKEYGAEDSEAAVMNKQLLLRIRLEGK